jgi:hypothetical protein
MLKNEEAKKRRTEESEKILFCLSFLPTANYRPSLHAFVAKKQKDPVTSVLSVAKKSNQELTK